MGQEVNPATEDDPQFFDASIGDRVVITTRASSGSPIEPLVKLFRTTGNVQVPLNGSNAFCSGVCLSPPSPGLPADDTYRIEVADQGRDETGSYDISIDAVSRSFDGAPNGPPLPTCGTAVDGATVLACGVSANGTIDFPSDSDAYVFDAMAGESIIATVRTDGSAADPGARLFGPFGDEVRLNGAFGFCPPAAGPGSVCLSETLLVDGTYTLVVWDLGLNDTGAYNVTLETRTGSFNGVSNGAPTPVCADTAVLGCGETIGGTIDVLGDSDAYVFNAMAGESVVATLRSDSSLAFPTARLFGPSGDEVRLNGAFGFCPSVAGPSGTCFSETLLADGIYTLVVWDQSLNDTGAYNVTLEAIAGSFDGVSNGPPTPVCADTMVLACGETVVGSIDALGDTDAYTFDAMAGERFVATLRSEGAGSPVDPVIRVFDPLGVEVSLNGTNDFCGFDSSGICFSETLDKTGTYTLVVWDASIDETGAYAITLDAISEEFAGLSNGPPAPVCGAAVDGTEALFCGDVLDAQIDLVADTDSFAFEAESGEEIVIRVEAAVGSAIQPVIRVFGPLGEVALNGAPVGTFCSGTCSTDPLPFAGTYTAVVWDGAVDQTGPYSLSMNGCTIAVDPTETYLHVAASDTAGDATPIPLALRGIDPGDTINVARFGDFLDAGTCPDVSTELCGIFSASDALDVQSGVDRVVDALDPTDGLECVTAPTDPDGEPTDVQEDFLISAPAQNGYSVQLVTVPLSATHLFVAAPDERYADNDDCEPDFGVVVVPEPGMPTLLGVGVAAVAALACRRGRRRRRTLLRRDCRA